MLALYCLMLNCIRMCSTKYYYKISLLIDSSSKSVYIFTEFKAMQMALLSPEQTPFLANLLVTCDIPTMKCITK